MKKNNAITAINESINDEDTDDEMDGSRYIKEIYLPNEVGALERIINSNEEEEDEETMPVKKMYWEPVADNTRPLPKTLRWILKDELKPALDKDGRTVLMLTVDNLEFLKGVASAEIEGAAKLYAALMRHKFINLIEREDEEL